MLFPRLSSMVGWFADLSPKETAQGCVLARKLAYLPI